MLRRFFVSLMVGVGLLIPTLTLATPQAGAVNLFPQCTPKSVTAVCQQQQDQLNKGYNPVIRALRVTITIMSYIIGVSAIIVIIVAGMRMVTSQGDPQGFNKARGAIIYSLIALAIVAAAETIVVFVLSKVGG